MCEILLYHAFLSVSKNTHTCKSSKTHRVDVVDEGQPSVPGVFHFAGDVGGPERV